MAGNSDQPINFNYGQSRRNPRDGEFTQIGAKTRTGIRKNEATKLSESFTPGLRTYTLTLSGALVTSNVVAGNVNGAAIDSVTFDTDSDSTWAAVAEAIEANPQIETAVVTEVASGTSNDRVITITPYNNTQVVALDSWTVTGGSSQATIAIAVSDNTLFDTMPVELNDNGTIQPWNRSNSYEINCIGWVTFQDGDLIERTTVALRGYMVILAMCDGATNAGPITYERTNRAAGYIEVSDSSVSETNHSGWALDAGSDGDLIRVLIKG